MADSVIGIVLAGGRGERLGGRGKAHLEISNGITLMQRVIGRLRPQCANLLVNVNEELPVSDGFPVVSDAVPQLGPLGGILAGLEWTAQHAPETTLIASAPVDAPFLPRDLVERRAVAGVARRRSAPRLAARRHPHGEPLSRTAPGRSPRVANDARRLVLQRQHAGRSRPGARHRLPPSGVLMIRSTEFFRQAGGFR